MSFNLAVGTIFRIQLELLVLHLLTIFKDHLLELSLTFRSFQLMLIFCFILQEIVVHITLKLRSLHQILNSRVFLRVSIFFFVFVDTVVSRPATVGYYTAEDACLRVDKCLNCRHKISLCILMTITLLRRIKRVLVVRELNRSSGLHYGA